MSNQPLGALLIHGFSGTPAGFGKLTDQIESLGLPYRAPTLNGHGAQTPNALKGVNWREWIVDCEKAMLEVLTEAEKVIFIGHSMGGCLGLTLAVDHQEKIESLIVAGGSPVMVSPFGPGRPLHFLAPIFLKTKKQWGTTPIFADLDYARYDTRYEWVPVEAFVQLFDLIKVTRERLPEVNTPILILHSKNDTTNSPKGAEVLFNNISTPKDQKQLVWFERTEHEMFLDCEQEEIIRTVVEYIEDRIKRNK